MRKRKLTPSSRPMSRSELAKRLREAEAKILAQRIEIESLKDELKEQSELID